MHLVRDAFPEVDRGAGLAAVLVLGIGRLDRGDDAAGRRAARRLRERLSGPVRIVECEGGMAELIDAWVGARAVVALDAVRSGALPGTLVRLDAAAGPLPLPAEASTHGLGLAEAVELARALDRLPRRFVVLGIEGECFEPDAALSPAVEAGLEELVRRAEEEARAMMAEDPRAGAGGASAGEGSLVGHERLRIEIQGAVQGVGFRPFVYRLAAEHALAGWVVNDARGVTIEVEGPPAALDAFRGAIASRPPEHARIHRLESHRLAPAGLTGFEIRHSEVAGEKSAVPLPDLATCPACRSEVLDPRDRRFRYPFANCTHCGPRFTILRELPYDRPRTTMSGFTLCPACRAEYEDPRDRRFHAQPIACPACGPRLTLRDRSGIGLAAGDQALVESARALRAGRIVAVKGLGGFHLMCDAADAAAVARLRERKPRRAKPFAVMVRDLDQAGRLCEVDEAAAGVLAAPEAPIVLLPARPGNGVAPAVAPGYPTLGVMLPATPLHHLLLAEVDRPLVATSGNLTDEPIAIDGDEARARLGQVAELWLDHDRPIERHMDDSVGWFVDREFRLLRRARGFAPLPVRVERELPPILAVGAHLKSVVALGAGRQVFLSQHIGDLETPDALDAFERVIADFLRLYEVRPAAIAHDLHPDLASTQWARRAASGTLSGARLIGVQHHHAHLAACLAEHGVGGPALGVTWDGTGYGPDGTVWGGEFLLGDAAGFERVAHLLPFRLPGGEAAVREPRRTALALLHALHGVAALERDDLAPVRSFAPGERTLLGRLLEGGLHAPLTTSAGRLFDGLAALIGLRLTVSDEGEAAIALEHLADRDERGAYPVELGAGPPGAPLVLDWRPAVAAALDDLGRGVAPARIAARFHGALVEAIAAVAARLGAGRVALTGGCFQNRLLVERTARRLRAAGHEVLEHRLVPPNDGGIGLGQVVVAAARLESGG